MKTFIIEDRINESKAVEALARTGAKAKDIIAFWHNQKLFVTICTENCSDELKNNFKLIGATEA